MQSKSSLLMVLFKWPGKKTTRAHQDGNRHSSQTTLVLFVTDVSGLDQHARMKVLAVLIFSKKILLFSLGLSR